MRQKPGGIVVPGARLRAQTELNSVNLGRIVPIPVTRYPGLGSAAFFCSSVLLTGSIVFTSLSQASPDLSLVYSLVVYSIACSNYLLATSTVHHRILYRLKMTHFWAKQVLTSYNRHSRYVHTLY
jgi:hypothetical protein